MTQKMAVYTDLSLAPSQSSESDEAGRDVILSRMFTRQHTRPRPGIAEHLPLNFDNSGRLPHKEPSFLDSDPRFLFYYLLHLNITF